METPEEYRIQRANGEPLIGLDGEHVSETSIVFTLEYELMGNEKGIVDINYVGNPPVTLQEELERTLSNQLGANVAFRKEQLASSKGPDVIRITPYEEEVVYPPEGVFDRTI